MYLNIKKHSVAKYFRIFNLDTKKKIKHVWEADDETGEYSYYPENEKGNVFIDPNNPSEIKSKTTIGNIKLIDMRKESREIKW